MKADPFLHHTFEFAQVPRNEETTPSVLTGGDSQLEIQQAPQPRNLAVSVRMGSLLSKIFGSLFEGITRRCGPSRQEILHLSPQHFKMLLMENKTSDFDGK